MKSTLYMIDQKIEMAQIRTIYYDESASSFFLQQLVGSSNTYIYRPQLLNCLNFLVFLPTYLLTYQIPTLFSRRDVSLELSHANTLDQNRASSLSSEEGGNNLNQPPPPTSSLESSSSTTTGQQVRNQCSYPSSPRAER